MKKNIVLVGILSVWLFGCQSDMAAFEKGNPAAENKVLVAGVSSEFKDAVVRKVIQELGTESYYFKGIGLSAFEKTDLTDYDAVLIVCMYYAGKIDDRARDYFANDPTTGKLIGLYTVGYETGNSKKPEWAIPTINIDAITSASEMNLVDKKADALVKLIKKRCEAN